MVACCIFLVLSRVSDYNQGDENIFRGTNLDYLRYSYDKIVNTRGQALLQYMGCEDQRLRKKN